MFVSLEKLKYNFEINSCQILFCLKLIFSIELGFKTQFYGKKNLLNK
jgi:hypothetical protein